MKADFHTHSTSSDGTLTPSELARRGRSAGLEAMAITDHDTVSGAREFCDTFGPGGFAGVELSAKTSTGTLHLVGLGIDPDHEQLVKSLATLREGRKQRGYAILNLMQKAGLAITLEDVQPYVGPDDVLARPHFARALMAKGYVSSILEAFERYLGHGCPCYAPRTRFSPEECINLIHQAGGRAVLAHPYQWTTDEDLLARRVRELTDRGLDALEAYYTGYNQGEVLALLLLAKRNNLRVSIASDFHGANKPTIHLGELPNTDCVNVLDDRL